MGQAGEKLGRTQPALTKGIQRLESAFGSPLFERDGRGIRLTAVGEVLLARAGLLRASADEAVREVTDFAQGRSGHVRIGTGPIAADDVLPQICALLLAQARQVTIEITVGPSSALREELRRGRDRPAAGSDARKAIPSSCAIPSSTTSSWWPPAHRTRSSTWPGRRCEPCWTTHGCCLPGRSPSRQWLDAAFEGRGLPKPSAQIEANSIPLLPRLIASSDLLSFVSRHTLGTGRQRGLREVALKETTLVRKLGVSQRKEGYLSPAAQQLLALLRARGPEIFSRMRPDGAASAKT